MNQAAGEEDSATPEEARLRRDFRRGNINFDFLQPESEAGAREAAAAPFIERRDGQREGKRGLFNRGRPPRPISRWHYALWGAMFLGAAGGAVALLWLQSSSLWLLLLPALLAASLWSLIMLALFKARPR